MSRGWTKGTLALLLGWLAIAGLAWGQKTRNLPGGVNPKSPLARHVTTLYNQSLATSPSLVSRDLNQAVWRVFYATNRTRVTDAKPGQAAYGPVAASPPRLDYGQAEVVIPALPSALDAVQQDSDAGSRVGAKGTGGELRPVECRSTQTLPYNKFYEELVRVVSKSPQRDVLVYVHGYNVRFDEAIRRAGQLGLEMPFNGVVVCYSWPSAGAPHAYAQDQDHADGTVRHLWKFLVALQSHLGSGVRINLVGHGLGCRALMQGVASIPKSVREARPFQHLVLASPDVGVDKFPVWLDKCRESVRNVTVYVSKGDEGLLASKNQAGQLARAGDANKLFIVPQVDTVEITALDRSFLGHGYRASDRAALNELFQLLKLDNPPAQRPWLREAKAGGKTYWEVVNQAAASESPERATKR